MTKDEKHGLKPETLYAEPNGSGVEKVELETLGYSAELQRNRSMLTLLFQSLAIAAIPYGEGAPIGAAILGGGQLSIFVGWIVVCLLAQCVALSLSEFASRYPTAGGPYYWSYQMASRGKTLLSFITGWTWLIGNWTITLSVNFGFAGMVAACVTLVNPDFNASAWQQLLIFYAICIFALVIVAFGNRFLPLVDTICAAFITLTIFITMIALSAKAAVGRHSASYALGNFDTSLNDYGGFTFFIGLLPAAYCFSCVGMISSMAEEVADPAVKVPRAMTYAVPVLGISGLFFIIPICVTMPDDLLGIVNAPYFQSLPYIYAQVMGSPGGGVALTALVLAVTAFCSISITCAASRCTWAMARDRALPLSGLFSRVDKRVNVPVWAVFLVTVVQMALGLINLGSTSAFTAFISVGVIALAVSYAIPILISMAHGRRAVLQARWTTGKIGWLFNTVAVAWIVFETVLFSMPLALPTTVEAMNYASVVLVGFGVFAAIWYVAYARKAYRGPPKSEGL